MKSDPTVSSIKITSSEEFWNTFSSKCFSKCRQVLKRKTIIICSLEILSGLLEDKDGFSSFKIKGHIFVPKCRDPT